MLAGIKFNVSFKKITAIVFVLIIVFCTGLFLGCFSNNSRSNPFNNIIRLHVRANSDEAICQAVKLQVRDAVLEFVNSELAQVLDHATAKGYIRQRLSRIRVKANSAVRTAGQPHTTRAEFGVRHFPTIQYTSGILQAGYYHALIIYIGTGSGSNWWCVIYQPLCFAVSDAQGGNDGFRYRSFVWDRITR